MPTPYIHWLLWLSSLHDFVGMMISHSHWQQTYCGQFIREWGFWLLRFFPFLVWMVLFLQWDVWLNGEFASWILLKKENLGNVHLEVQLWILKKMSSIKFICIEAHQKSGTPLVQFVAEGNNPRDIYMLTEGIASNHLYPWPCSSNFWFPASLHPSSYLKHRYGK
jgi:hypothetical protein